MLRQMMLIAIVSLAVMGPMAEAAAPTPCADLTRLALPEATITAAEQVPAGEFAPPAGPRLTGLPAFCRVAITVVPQVHIEVWLPSDSWNGRFRGEGGGGYAGSISYGGLAAGIQAGYATASTDTGHPASAGGTFALNADRTLNMALIRDFAERSLHEMAVKAKAIVNAYYGMSCDFVSLLMIVTREPTGTVTVLGEMPVAEMVSVAAIVPSLPPEGEDGLSLPQDTAATERAAMNTRVRMGPIRRTSSRC